MEFVRQTAAAVLAIAMMAGGAAAQGSSTEPGQPLTVEAAIEPDAEMLVEAIRMAPENSELFVELSDQITEVAAVDVAEIADGEEAVGRAAEESETEMALLRTAFAGNEPVSEAMEDAGIRPEDVIAAQVIQGDVTSVVLYYAR